MGRKNRKWDELDLSEKLGYWWVGLFVVLCLATAVAIFIPITEEWVEEAEYTMSEEGQADAEDDDDYDYDDEDDEDYDDDEDEDYDDEDEESED
jgi:hypothetical protein